MHSLGRDRPLRDRGFRAGGADGRARLGRAVSEGVLSRPLRLEQIRPDDRSAFLVVVLPAFGEEPSVEGGVRVTGFAGECPASLVGGQMREVAASHESCSPYCGELTLDDLFCRCDRRGALATDGGVLRMEVYLRSLALR